MATETALEKAFKATFAKAQDITSDQSAKELADAILENGSKFKATVDRVDMLPRNDELGAVRWVRSEEKYYYFTGSAWVAFGSGGGTYTLPIATDTVLGGVKAGTLVTITVAGVLGLSAGVVAALADTGSGAVAAHVALADPHGDRAYSIQRANHTGTQVAATISDFASTANGLIDTKIATHVGLADPHSQYILESREGVANGIATLDYAGKVLTSQLPALAITDTFVVASQSAMLALSCEVGDVAVRTDINKTFILKTAGPSVLANWQELLTPTDAVQSVFGRSGVVVATTGDYTFAQISGSVGASQMPALTGDVTTTAGAVVTTIGANKVTLGMMAQVATGTFLGRSTASTGDVEAMSASTAKTLLALTKSDVGLGSVENTALSTWAGNTSITSIGTLATGTVPWARLSNVPTTFTPTSHASTATTYGVASATDYGHVQLYTATGTSTSGTMDQNSITNALAGKLSANQTITLSGDVSGSGTTALTTTIGANKVTLGMMAQVATGTFLGRSTASTGNVEAMSASTAKTLLALTKSDVGLGNVENTTLSTWAGSANITAIGTLASGTVPWARLSNIPANLTSLGGLSYVSGAFVKMTSANTFTLDTNIYLTANQSITLSGIIMGSGTTTITTTIADNALSIAKTSGLQTALDGKALSSHAHGIIQSNGTIAGDLLSDGTANNRSLGSATNAFGALYSSLGAVVNVSGNGCTLQHTQGTLSYIATYLADGVDARCDMGTSLKRWNNGFFAGTVTATSFAGSLSGTASDSSKLNGQSASFYATASHTHGNITNSGAIGTTADLPIKTTTSGVLIAGAWGTTAGTFCQGNDSRLSDSRTPTAHVLDSASHTISGKTAGHVLRATSATAYSFGTLDGNAFGSQSANLHWASPNGSAGVPTFRALAKEDIPTTLHDTIMGNGAVATVSTYGVFGYSTLASSGIGFNANSDGAIRVNSSAGKSIILSANAVDLLTTTGTLSTFSTAVTAKQLANSVQSTSTTTGAIAWDLSAGSTLDLTAVLTGAVTLNITNPVAGSVCRFMLKQSAIVSNVTLSLTGVTWIRASNTTSTSNTQVLGAGQFSGTAGAYYIVEIFWVSTTKAYTSVHLN